MDYIAEPLRSLAVPISELHEDPANARKGHAVDRIAASLKLYGQRKPIVVNRAQGGKVEAGNGTLAAAKSLSWTHIAAVFVDDDAATAAAYGIADNRVGEFSEWDADILGNLMPTLDGLFTGFLPAELDAILPQQHTEGDTEPQVDRADELRQKWGVESGQMWRLGEHRIICGDCTDAAVVDRVLQGEKPTMMVTDPPYGVEYDPSWRNEAAKKGLISFAARREGNVMNDDRTDWSDAWALFPGDVAYCWHADRHASEVQRSLESANFEIRCQIVWAKQAFAIGRGNYHWQHEPCWYAVRKGGTGHWVGDHSQTTLWHIKWDKNAEGGHSTQKPLECMTTPIRNHKGDVYEPFSGSGTTIIACENLGRKCRAVEISPDYVAVAIERWATHTGGTPELLP